MPVRYATYVLLAYDAEVNKNSKSTHMQNITVLQAITGTRTNTLLVYLRIYTASLLLGAARKMSSTLLRPFSEGLGGRQVSLLTG